MENLDGKRNILVVDDEAQITRVLKTTLSAQGYAIRTATDGKQALQEMKGWSPDLVITDLRMPNMDGLQLCRSIRGESRIPIIVLSVKGEEAIKVEALDAGADDYITKPFSINELLARVRAALRRASVPLEPNAEGSDSESAGEVLEDGDFRIDTRRHAATLRGEPLELTGEEFDVLVFLTTNPQRVVTPTQRWRLIGQLQEPIRRNFSGCCYLCGKSLKPRPRQRDSDTCVPNHGSSIALIQFLHGKIGQAHRTELPLCGNPAHLYELFMDSLDKFYAI
jgi:two-component system, OmpR family, KDP operon response regulator KdpE